METLLVAVAKIVTSLEYVCRNKMKNVFAFKGIQLNLRKVFQHYHLTRHKP